MRTLLSVLFLASLTQASETWVIAAGVEQYDDPGISALQYAATDARAVAEAFRAAGVPEKNVELYVNGAAERLWLPTRANLLRALQRARTRATGDDTLVFLFAGHGIEQNGQAYLLTVDTNRELLNDTALSMDLVDKALSGFEGGHVLFLIDACRNDPDAGRGQRDCPLTDGLARGLRPKLAERGQSARPAALLLACDVGQRAWEMPDEGHGAFTYWLLEGLRTAGQAGGVRVSALAEYVEQQVSGWARRARREQTPRFNNPSGRDFTLPCPAPAKPAPPPQPRPAQPQPTPEPAAPANWEQGVPPTGPPPAGWPDYLQWPPATNPELRFRVHPQDGMPQVLVPAGEFGMGSATGSGEPQRQVFVSAFWMDLHEVTVGQYKLFCADSGCALKPNFNQDDRHPVVQVNWYEANGYAAWAGRSLPTEAQWEKAARAGTATRYPWGDLPNRKLANLREAGLGTTAAVGSFPPNGFGLHDMVGNVMEWCRDWFAEDWYAHMPERDPVNTTPTALRAVRGRHWGSKFADFQPSGRWGTEPDYGSHGFYGFRCVSEATVAAE